ncbi:hypothetical protein [Clostridium estertheticum]|uniref:hypothetical protein n=1 Tax=Clostridium estertheticum TaxID=238834 RepID=UPI001C7D3844|nr:hypothetical protein [Clostridium estertheticum]MBX4266593.1 hypothetical protein [Clostridium estertheticum]WLC88069.1 hypothetical protein KTC95_18930 [Clostridium estertheticum]
MSLENEIKDIISKKLEDGTIEKLLSEQLESGIKKSLDNILGNYGDVTKILEKKIKEVMVPFLENYDYSKYIIKLDSVLVDVLKDSTLENRTLLGNFKNLMMIDPDKKTIKSSEIFEEWKKYVAKNVETSGLDICEDEQPCYEDVEVTIDFDENDSASWESFEYGTLLLQCEHDENMNFALKLSRWKQDKDKKWDISYSCDENIKSLRFLNDFKIFLMKLDQARIKLELDITCESYDVEPDTEPEASFT